MKNNWPEASIIVSWVGWTDISSMLAWRAKNGQPVPQEVADRVRGSGDEAPGANGPIRTLSDNRSIQCQYLLFSREFAPFAEMTVEWVRRGNRAPCHVVLTDVANPGDYQEVYKATEKFFQANWRRQDAALHQYNLTPGTPVTHSIMLYMSQVRYAGGQAWQVVGQDHAIDGEQCFRVELPFRIAVDDLVAEQGNPIVRGPEFAEIIQYAQVRSVSILLLGETGVGKSRTARLIHQACGGRPENFVAVNCAALASGDTFRAEMFGAKKGSFTGAVSDLKGAFERAQSGTLFLDEVGEIPARWQPTLLRALEDGTIEPLGAPARQVKDVRIIAATNRDLLQDVRDGLFREDLYYRIAMYPVRLASLREIRDRARNGFVAQVDGMLASIAGSEPGLAKGWQIDQEAMTLLANHDWPGNFRQLRHVLTLACIAARTRASERIDVCDIRKHLDNSPVIRKTGGFSASTPANLEKWLEEQKRTCIVRTLAETDNNVAKAAKRLGYTYQKLIYYIKKNGIDIQMPG